MVLNILVYLVLDSSTSFLVSVSHTMFSGRICYICFDITGSVMLIIYGQAKL